MGYAYLVNNIFDGGVDFHFLLKLIYVKLPLFKRNYRLSGKLMGKTNKHIQLTKTNKIQQVLVNGEMPTYRTRSGQHHDFSTGINLFSFCKTLHNNWSCWQPQLCIEMKGLQYRDIVKNLTWLWFTMFSYSETASGPVYQQAYETTST